jgi:DNA-binding transcriptional ArsR family regulator
VRVNWRLPEHLGVLSLAITAVCTLTGTYPTRYIHLMEMLLRTLADDSRRTVLEELRVRPATVNELASVLPIARPGVSRHLRVLREAGLVEVRRDAQRRIYSLRPEPLAELDAWLSPYRALWHERMSALHEEIARGKSEGRST